jgi:5-methylcytosine-specific restriction protein A
LECHHVVWLAEGGDDHIENTVALCPNCHRRMHVLNAPADREKLKTRIASRPSD